MRHDFDLSIPVYQVYLRYTTYHQTRDLQQESRIVLVPGNRYLNITHVPLILGLVLPGIDSYAIA